MNSGFDYSERAGRESVGLSVLSHLAERHRHSSEEVWRERIAAGEVRVDGARATAEDLLRVGQRIVWSRPPWEEPSAPLAFAVLYRDAQLLAVAKPSGLPTVPNGGYLTHTLLHVVRQRFPEAVPLHRLGRATSGLVVFALTRDARRRLSAAWRAGRVAKTYRALVTGTPAEAAFSIDAPIGLVPHARLGRVHAATADGKPAVTHVRVLARRGSDALVEAHIPTGRPHQIRIHLAAAGYPLAGDRLYATGGGLRPDPGLPGDPGYRLHAHRLRFDHPATGERLELECAPPPVLRS